MIMFELHYILKVSFVCRLLIRFLHHVYSFPYGFRVSECSYYQQYKNIEGEISFVIDYNVPFTDQGEMNDRDQLSAHCFR